MKPTNSYHLMQGTGIFTTVLQLSDLLKEMHRHPEFTRLPQDKQKVLQTILRAELTFQRQQLDKMLRMVSL